MVVICMGARRLFRNWGPGLFREQRPLQGVLCGCFSSPPCWPYIRPEPETMDVLFAGPLCSDFLLGEGHRDGGLKKKPKIVQTDRFAPDDIMRSQSNVGSLYSLLCVLTMISLRFCKHSARHW